MSPPSQLLLRSSHPLTSPPLSPSQEDLDESEADEARKRYLEQQASGGEFDYAAAAAKHAENKTAEYSNKAERRVAARMTHLSLGVHGLRDEILNLEDALAGGLQKHGSAWTLSHGGRQSWLLSCRGSTSVVELASLLKSLEETVRGLQVCHVANPALALHLRASPSPSPCTSRSAHDITHPPPSIRTPLPLCPSAHRVRPTRLSASRGAPTATPSSAAPPAASLPTTASQTAALSVGCQQRERTQRSGT